MIVPLSVRDLKLGMVLAEPVVGEDGQQNLPVGVEFTARHIGPLDIREVNRS